MNPPLKELVIVVHGVGDPEPGETVSLFARGTSDPAHPMIENDETLWLHEDSSVGRFEYTYPVHTRTRQTSQGRVVFGEVFWGDLSKVRRGILGVIRGIFEIIFGLRYVAYVAADQPHPAARRLQRLGILIARLLHGPVLALNAILAALVVGIAGTEALWPGSSDNAEWSGTLIATIFLALLVGSITLWRNARTPVQERFWFWVLIGTLLLGLQWFAVRFAPFDIGMASPRRMYWYARGLVVTMSCLWFVMMVLIILMGLTWLFSRTNARINRRGLSVAFLLPVLTIGIWGQLLPMIWLCGERALSGLTARDDTQQASQSEIVLPFLMAPTIRIQEPKLARFADLFKEAVPLLGIQCVMCVVLGLMQVVIFIYYASWRPRNSVRSFLRGRRPPRLIVNFWVQLCCAVCTCIGVLLVLILGWNEISTVGPRRAWLLNIVAEANKYAIGLMVPLAGLFLVAFRYLDSVLDIALDVINHFCFSRTDVDPPALSFEDEFDGGDFASGKLQFWKRKKVQSRMVQLISYFGAGSEKGRARPDLTIVSHSQGTLIAIEVLNSHQLDWIRGSFGKIRLVTMGSPFSHIYQYYFGNHYPPLNQPFWSNLRTNVDHWLNIFRVDDFVGTAIDFPPGLDEAGGPLCQNFPVECCGHNNYWTDKEVIGILKRDGHFSWLEQNEMNANCLAFPSSQDHLLRKAA